MTTGKKIHRTKISDTLVADVHHEDGYYAIYATNKSTTDKMILRVNFAGSVNMLPRKSPETKIIGTTVEAILQPKSQALVAYLDPVDPNEKYSYKFVCAAKMVFSIDNGGEPTPPPPGMDKSLRKELSDKLDIMINSINHGYNLMIDNLHETATFTVTLNLEESQNLKIIPEGSAKQEGKSVTVVVGPRSCARCVDMPVIDMDLGSCELRYTATIKKSP